MYKESFGTSRDGSAVTIYDLENAGGMKVRVTDYGATLVSIFVPDRDGNMLDVLLGYDNVTGYEEHRRDCFGALIGRNANRIANAQVTINDVVYKLDQNDNENNLHSENHGMNCILWDVKEYTGRSIKLCCVSADLEQGFPGNMNVEVIYNLTDENELEIHYQAVSDKDTVANFTNHSYFNLAGHDSGDILGHELMIRDSYFTPIIDAKAIPTGEIVPVKGTPMDFNEPKTVGRDIDSDDVQLGYGFGYDHNYVLDKSEKGAFELMAQVYAPSTGIEMKAYTDRPGVQLYTGNFIATQNGKQGAVYERRQGLCLESQFYPNAVNEPNFESPMIKANEVYQSKTSYQFCVR